VWPKWRSRKIVTWTPCFRHVISLNDCLNFSLALNTAPTSVFVLVLNRIEEKTMEHHAQALLALSISAALCLGTVATTEKLSIYISRPRAIRGSSSQSPDATRPALAQSL
jgi:hypothetical protein